MKENNEAKQQKGENEKPAIVSGKKRRVPNKLKRTG